MSLISLTGFWFLVWMRWLHPSDILLCDLAMQCYIYIWLLLCRGARSFRIMTIQLP